VLAKARVSFVRRNLKEAGGKFSADEQELHIRLMRGDEFAKQNEVRYCPNPWSKCSRYME